MSNNSNAPEILDSSHQGSAGMPSMTWQTLLRGTVGRALVYGVLWRTLSAWLLGPLTVAVLHLFLKLSQEQAVTNTQMASFFLSPSGASAAFVVAVLSVATWALEQAGFTFLMLQQLRGRSCSIDQIFRALCWSAPTVLRTATWPVLAAVLAVIPFAATMGAVYYFLLSGTDINFYLAERPPRFLVALALGALIGLAALIVLIRLLIRWVYTPAICLDEGLEGRAALQQSQRETAGKRRQLLIWIFLWFATTSLFSSLSLAVWGWLCHLLFDRGVGHWSYTAGIVGLLILITAGLVSTLGILHGYTLALLATWSYYQGRADRRQNELATSQLTPSTPRLSRTAKLAVGTVLAIVFVSSLIHARVLVLQSVVRKSVDITAHRAGARRAPENSLSALKLAIDEGAQFAEIDVQRTADDVIVVVHDQDLQRLAGLPLVIRQATLDQIREADIGSRFSEHFRGERVATLAQFVEAAQGRIRLNIELKYYGFDDDLATRVVALLQEARFLDQALITSLDLRGLQQVRRLEPRLKLGTIVSAKVGDITKLDVDFLSLRQSLVTPSLRQLAAKRDLPIHVWTPNTSTEMMEMMLRGADNLITDDPALGHEVIDWYAEQTDEELVLLHFWDLLN